MKKIINGKRYDTDTAKKLASDWYSNRTDFHYWEETLYRKNTGEYFLHGEGGPASKYAQSVGQNSWSGGEKIIPLSVENARKWAEDHLDGDEYEKIFGVIEETSSEKRTVAFSLTEAVIEKIKNGAATEGISMSEYVSRLVEAQ